MGIREARQMIRNETYSIRFLTPKIIFVQWYQTPMNGSLEGLQFIRDLNEIVNEADTVVYILSDLREGRLIDVVQIRQLSKITKNPNYGGSVAFADDYQTSVYAGLFATAAKRTEEVQPDLAKALAHLEEIAPGVTAGIDVVELKAQLG